MTTRVIRQPRTVADAVKIIRDAERTSDVADQRELHSVRSLERTFGSGQRSPDLVWTHAGGLIAARQLEDGLGLIDIVVLPPDPLDHAALIAAVASWAASQHEVELSLYGPPRRDGSAPGGRSPGQRRKATAPSEHSDVPSLVAHGWRRFVTRHQYAMDANVPPPSVATLPLERATPGDRERLERLVRRSLVGSLDAHDRKAIAEVGLDAAARAQADYLVGADPIEAIRFLPGDDGDDALVSWITLAEGRGVLLQVYVAPEARGKGLARALVSHATAALRSEGAHRLIAATDHDNWPMARAFADAGWLPTSTRSDLLPPA